MSTALMVSFRDPVLPWQGSLEDDQRFQRVLRTVLILFLLFCLIVWFVPIKAPDRSKPTEISARLSNVMVENALPPPQVELKPVVDTSTKANPDSKQVSRKDNARKVVPSKEAPVPEARDPQPNKRPGEVDAARRKAAGVGLLSMSNDLAELRGAPMAVQLAPVKKGAGIGSGVGVGVGAGTDAGLPTRSLITSNATGGSGGINTAGYSSNTGGGGLAGRATTLVEGVAGGGGGGGKGGGGNSAKGGHGDGTGAGRGPGGSVQRGSSGKISRSLEDIRIVFERNKGAIYSLYNRTLREDPTLQGKVVFELKISPDGSVASCRIISSELKSPELEAKLIARIKQFDFGAKDVDIFLVNYPLDFLPS